MILDMCASVDVSKNLDILTLEFSITMGASSILTWVLADTASAACPAHPGNLDIMSMTFAAVICDADDPRSVNTAWIIFHTVTSEYNSAFVFLVLCLQLRIPEMTDAHQRRKMYCFALFPCFSDHLIFRF